MNGYITNIEQDSIQNTNFRKVVYTARHMQLVLMSLMPGEEIGEEVHELDQFLRIDAGTGKAVLDGVEHDIADGFALVVPQGMKHNIINTGGESLKLYTIYAPPDHKDGEVQATKADAIENEQPFDGVTTE
ncbi:MAG: cupin domain-containing protein [Candidatus Doudnabacteria bacterium]|nr:cupin domain-containing protein [Candidatus Doudnabacteria bacterium]